MADKSNEGQTPEKIPNRWLSVTMVSMQPKEEQDERSSFIRSQPGSRPFEGHSAGQAVSQTVEKDNRLPLSWPTHNCTRSLRVSWVSFSKQIQSHCPVISWSHHSHHLSGQLQHYVLCAFGLHVLVDGWVQVSVYTSNRNWKAGHRTRSTQLGVRTSTLLVWPLSRDMNSPWEPWSPSTFLCPSQEQNHVDG